jgi:adenylylsulfate kinase-like enzyme
MGAARVIVIGGPIASGKSTLARAVVGLLGARGVMAAAIDLDEVYERVDMRGGPKDHGPTWSLARFAAGGFANALFLDGLEVVVAEGDFLREEERAEFAGSLGSSPSYLYVTLTAPLEAALERVQLDPDRGLSRDPQFLTRHYTEVADALAARPAGELVIDTGSVTVGEAAQKILERVDLV